ncbi:hypothetical protein SD70_16915 [Gordoniibacillus kamchatkensis]|uniref:Uncharacterized protein n=1 Tax=Gordoniibacillus kamchatkensis TaxID=1590651 RepID=A0ABR5AFT5_9BACL|nr:hypothetical protein [Paenibacillus sp. VKM B-2647]KIL39909.1 hypothetical protein SD70_16915 [Paenibacillus sp. VKM B-2647]
MSFVIILLGVLLSGSLFSLGFMSLVKRQRLLGVVFIVLSVVLFVSMFVFIKEAPPIQSLD